jgi:hypothetical protein
MALTPITRKENFLAKAAGDPNALDLDPITREEWFISQIQGGGGGGGSVTSVNGKTGAVVLTASDVGAAAAETVVEVTGSTPTIEPAATSIYKCGELTSLTISNPPATGKYGIIFYSGATATTTVGIENFVAEANKRYKITVEDNYATYDSWPYTPT